MYGKFYGMSNVIYDPRGTFVVLPCLPMFFFVLQSFLHFHVGDDCGMHAMASVRDLGAFYVILCLD